MKNLIATKPSRLLYVLMCLFGFASCATLNAPLVKNISQPNHRPIRNFTSFSTSLRCMDTLLASAGRQRVFISSTGINDLSKKISVGADEMLLNAINKTNIKSGAYIFLDQSFEKEVGQLELLSPTKKRKIPQFYFRGAITQVDADTVNDKINLSLDLTNAPHAPTIHGGALKTANPSISRRVSIVSVDMHLVSYPDKVVLAGGSVANSMVVTNKTFGTGSSGLIKLTGYNMAISFNRVESIGQAVRNLVELGVIELIGRHAKLPYWQCLNIEPTSQKLENLKRQIFTVNPKPISISKAQHMLGILGYLQVSPTGIMDQRTHAAVAKFQADKGLIATGILDFDAYTYLLQTTKGYPVNGRNYTQNQTFPKVLQKPDGNHLKLTYLRSNYRLNDTLTVKLTSKSAGYATCFHQTGAGNVTQILPVEPNIRLRIPAYFSTYLPRKKSSFSLKFTATNVPENILCTLQSIDGNISSPYDNKFNALNPLPVKNLMDIPTEYTKIDPLKDWVMISNIATP